MQNFRLQENSFRQRTTLRTKVSLVNKIADLVVELNDLVIYSLFQDKFG